MTPHFIAIALITLVAAALDAHHSIAGMYDNSRPVKIDGVVTQYQFVSPHPFLDLRDTKTSQTWRLEMDNRGELTAIGVNEQTLKPGDRLVVTGSPARREPNRMDIERLERPADGFGFEQYTAGLGGCADCRRVRSAGPALRIAASNFVGRALQARRANPQGSRHRIDHRPSTAHRLPTRIGTCSSASR